MGGVSLDNVTNISNLGKKLGNFAGEFTKNSKIYLNDTQKMVSESIFTTFDKSKGKIVLDNFQFFEGFQELKIKKQFNLDFKENGKFVNEKFLLNSLDLKKNIDNFKTEIEKNLKQSISEKSNLNQTKIKEVIDTTFSNFNDYISKDKNINSNQKSALKGVTQFNDTLPSFLPNVITDLSLKCLDLYDPETQENSINNNNSWFSSAWNAISNYVGNVVTAFVSVVVAVTVVAIITGLAIIDAIGLGVIVGAVAVGYFVLDILIIFFGTLIDCALGNCP